MNEPRRPHGEARGDDGYSLIELLISLMLLSIVVIGVLGLITTLLISGDRARTQADAESLARSAAEEVKAWKYEGCTPSPYTASPLPAAPQGSGLVYQPILVTYGAPDPTGTQIGYSPLCAPSATRTQRVTVRVATTAGDVLAKAIVTKRRPCGPAAVAANGTCTP